MVNHFSRIIVFGWLSRSFLFICLMNLCTFIPIVFLSSFLTWGFHSHFVGVRYTTKGPIERNVVHFGSHSCSLPYSINPPYLCFPFTHEWYAYSRSYIKCDFLFFSIAIGIFNIRAFSVANEMYNFIYKGWTTLYHFLLVFLLLIQVFVFWAHRWDQDHLLNHLWLKFFMRILGWYLAFLCL
jgi:hypothetical protein